MFKHLIKLAWANKSRNILVIFETLIAFSLLSVLFTFGIFVWQQLSESKGFEHENIWSIQIRSPYQMPTEWTKSDYQMFLDMKESLLNYSEIQEVAFNLLGPYSYSNWGSDIKKDNRSYMTGVNLLDPDSFKLLDIKTIEGRAFSQMDVESDLNPVIINQKLRKTLFADGKAIGETFLDSQDVEHTVVGVVDTIKMNGEFDAVDHYMIKLLNLYKEAERYIGFSMQIKVRDDVGFEVEKKIIDHLNRFSKSWTFGIKRVELTRDSYLEQNIRPLIIGSVVGIFLLLMVAFGLFGVLWQNVTSRVKEIAIRRAMGATARQIQNQIISERVLLSLISSLIAGTFLVQLPISGSIWFISWNNFIAGFIMALIFIVVITIICAWYPSRLAMSFQPSTALHYE